MADVRWAVMWLFYAICAALCAIDELIIDIYAPINPYKALKIYQLCPMLHGLKNQVFAYELPKMRPF